MKYLFVLFAISFIVSCTKKEEQPKPPQDVPQKITKENLPTYEGIDFTGTNLTRFHSIVSGDDISILDKSTGTAVDTFPKSTWGTIEFFPVKGHYVVRPHPAIELTYLVDSKKKVTKRVECKKITEAQKPSDEIAKFITSNGCKI